MITSILATMLLLMALSKRKDDRHYGPTIPSTPWGRRKLNKRRQKLLAHDAEEERKKAYLGEDYGK